MKTIYLIDAAGALVGPVTFPVVPGVGVQLPPDAVELPSQLAKPATGYAWSLVNGAVVKVQDNRGTVYSTTTGEQQQYEQLGALPDTVTTTPRPTADYAWSGTEWVFDAVLRAKNMTALCAQLGAAIDGAADMARQLVVGDALRAVEYQNAAAEARAFKDAGYPADAVPQMVSAWAIAGRTPQQAADEIITEADLYTEGLAQIRTARLAAKEQVRVLLLEHQVEQAQAFADQTCKAIIDTVAGLGYNAPEPEIPVTDRTTQGAAQ